MYDVRLSVAFPGSREALHLHADSIQFFSASSTIVIHSLELCCFSFVIALHINRIKIIAYAGWALLRISLFTILSEFFIPKLSVFTITWLVFAHCRCRWRVVLLYTHVSWNWSMKYFMARKNIWTLTWLWSPSPVTQPQSNLAWEHLDLTNQLLPSREPYYYCARFLSTNFLYYLFCILTN